MKLAIMQPYLFPYIGYFQLVHAVDKFVVYDDVNYIKQGWINRNRILLANKVNYISVPVTNASSFVPINTVGIAQVNNWQTKWLKTIKQAYSKALYFYEVFPLIESVVTQQHDFIAELAVNSIKVICAYLTIPTLIAETATLYNNNQLRAEQRVLDICRQENCREYINVIGGASLYSKETFAANNIQLRFLQSKEIIYKQFSPTFSAWLSIIDVLMHNSKTTTQEFLNHYQLS